MGPSFCAAYLRQQLVHSDHRTVFPSPTFRCPLRITEQWQLDRYSQRRNRRRLIAIAVRDGRRMVLTAAARADASTEKSGAQRWVLADLLLGILGVIGGPVSRCLKAWMRCSRLACQTRRSAPAITCLLAVIKLAALVRCCRLWFSRRANFSGSVRRRRARPDAACSTLPPCRQPSPFPALSSALTLVVTRDGWLSLFMAAVVVPDSTLLPLLCIVMLPAWLLLAGKPMMMVNRPKQQPPHDNV